ncbi:MAG: glycoside hydrolase family 26 protein, partial [Solirubrobacteraceae bacterium]
MAPTPHLLPLRRPLTLLLSLLAIVVMLTLMPASSRASSPGGTLGVYAGSGKPDAVAAFETQLGRPVAFVHDAFARQSWSAMIDVDWWINQWRPTKYDNRVIYSVPMLPDTGGTLAAGAAGQYNGYFRTIAQRLVAGGEANAVLRLGWEMNGTWFKWSMNVPNGAADYAAYWRQIVTTMRSVPGAHFKFDWCPAADSPWVNGQQIKAEAAWPGGAYVDYIGLDIYDKSWVTNYQDPAARWTYNMNTGNGMRWHRDFARAKGKPMTFPEWGLSKRADGHGGGDAPYFIEQMYSWIKANNVAYNLYFEFADDGDHRIFSGDTPLAAKRFRELFGRNGDRAGSGTENASATGSRPAKLNIRRVRISPRSRKLSLVATLAPQASGAARVTLTAGGRKTSFSKRVSGGRLNVSRKISRALARKGAGTVTVSYGGNAQTRPQKVRLRVARGNPKLRLLAGPRIN